MNRQTCPTCGNACIVVDSKLYFKVHPSQFLWICSNLERCNGNIVIRGVDAEEEAIWRLCGWDALLETES